jgi:hypothetical protein
MAKAIGRLVNLGIGKETTRGTVAAATYWLFKTDLNYQEKFEQAVDESSVGVIADAIDAQIVKKWAEGSFGGDIKDKSIGLILLALFGSVSSALKGGESVVYEHTFSMGNTAQHPSLTLGIDDPWQDYQFALAMIESLEIKYERGKFVAYTANFKSKKGATATLTASYSAENSFRPQDFAFKMATALSGLDAAPAVVIKSATLKFEKNLEVDDVLGSVDPADILNKQFVCSGTIEALFDDEATFKTIVLGDTAKAVRFDIKNTTVTIGTSANPELKLDLAKAKFSEITRATPIGDLVKQTLAFKAFYSLSDSKLFQCVLTNLAVSY